MVQVSSTASIGAPAPLATVETALAAEFSPTFSFELNLSRQQAITSIVSGEYDSAQINGLLHSVDMVERLAGAHLGTRSEGLAPDIDAQALVQAIAEIAGFGIVPLTRRSLEMAASIGRAALPALQLIGNNQMFYQKTELEESKATIAEINTGKTTPRYVNNPPGQARTDLAYLVSPFPLTDASGGTVLGQKLNQAKDLNQLFQTEFGDRYIGLVAAGSVEKGYVQPESDIDVAVIGTDLELSRYYGEALLDYGVTHFYASDYIDSQRDIAPPFSVGYKDGIFNPLFQGIFTGNRLALSGLQSVFLNGLGAKEWERYRLRMVESEVANNKAAQRHGLNINEQEDLQLMRLLRRIPPTYDEMTGR